MISKNKFKWSVLTVVLTILLLVTVSLAVSAESTQEQAAIESCSIVSAELKGIAIRKVDSERTRSNITMILTLDLAERQGSIRPIKSGQGTVTLNETSYEVVEANGIVQLRRNAALLKLSCKSTDCVIITLKLRAKYFWMGGSLYVVRGSGILNTEGEKMPVFFRGKANIS